MQSKINPSRRRILKIVGAAAVTLGLKPRLALARPMRGSLQPWNADGAGVNATPLGFINPMTLSAWTTVMTSGRLDELRAYGIKWMRVPFNATACFDVADNHATELAQLDILRTVLTTCVGKGFNVLLDIHITTAGFANTGWTANDIYTAYPAGAKWLRFIDFVKRCAALVDEFSPARVALQGWNEVDGTRASWKAAMLAMVAAIRTVNPRCYTVVCGDNFSGFAGLTALDPTGFDAKVIFGLAPYEPYVFTHQGIPGQETGVYSGLTYPPNTADRTAIHAMIDASALTGPEKTAWKGYINDFLDTPFNAAWLDSYVGAAVTAWAATWGIPARRIIVQEFGAHRSQGTPGATKASFIAWLTAFTGVFKARGFSYAVWHYDDGPFSLVDSSSYDLDPAVMAALQR